MRLWCRLFGHRWSTWSSTEPVSSCWFRVCTRPACHGRSDATEWVKR